MYVWQNFKDDEENWLSIWFIWNCFFFYDTLFEVYKKPEYQIKLLECEKINNLVSTNEQRETFVLVTTLGYGWMLLKLKETKISILKILIFQALDEAFTRNFN
jgi:hypothetical protein